jgi:hypothetical protein
LFVFSWFYPAALLCIPLHFSPLTWMGIAVSTYGFNLTIFKGPIAFVTEWFLHCTQKDKRTKPGNLQTKQRSSGNRGALARNYFHVPYSRIYFSADVRICLHLQLRRMTESSYVRWEGGGQFLLCTTLNGVRFQKYVIFKVRFLCATQLISGYSWDVLTTLYPAYSTHGRGCNRHHLSVRNGLKQGDDLLLLVFELCFRIRR